MLIVSMIFQTGDINCDLLVTKWFFKLVNLLTSFRTITTLLWEGKVDLTPSESKPSLRVKVYFHHQWEWTFDAVNKSEPPWITSTPPFPDLFFCCHTKLHYSSCFEFWEILILLSWLLITLSAGLPWRECNGMSC